VRFIISQDVLTHYLTPTLNLQHILDSSTLNVFFINNLTPELYPSELLNVPTNKLPNLPEEFDYLNTEIRRRHLKYPHLTFEEVYQQMISPGSDGINMALRMIEDEEKTPINHTNVFYHNNVAVDVTKLSHKEVLYLAANVDNIENFEALEHIRSTYMITSPNTKLYYPEPFVASASFIHNDIGFIHILQYQF